MKKFLLAGLCFCCLFAFTGCQKSVEALVKENMSEITNSYYWVENNDFSVSVSVGSRENPYLIDGIHHAIVDFSLIIFKDKTFTLKDKEIKCNVYVNDQISEVKLEYNPISYAYMVDLGFAINEKDSVVFEYEGQKESLKLISNDFQITSTKALEMSCQRFAELIERYTAGRVLRGECYLKVLGLKGDDNNLFWCFTFVGNDNKSFNLIISTKDGSVLASDF